MARRTDHSRKELAELVVGTATQIISEGGLQALTTRKIASKIGYSAGSIYNVFENLDAVIANVNTKTLRVLNGTLSDLEMTGDVMADARALLHEYLVFREKYTRLWTALVQHSSREDLQQPDHFVDELETAFQYVENVVAPLYDDKDARDARIDVRVLWASLQGISNLPSNAPIKSIEGESTASLSANLVETYLTGIQSGVRAASEKATKENREV